MEKPDPTQKGSCWKSLLSVLLDAAAEPMDIYLVELAPGDEWEFAFWSYDPQEIPVTYRCKVGRSIWAPVETPCYTGDLHPYQQAADERSGRPKRG